MIISASRRTDIAAFYSEWLINRVIAGYCTVPNPVNKKQVSYVSLKPEDVDVIVFWTRNPRPLMSKLSILDERNLRYYFQYTVMDNPRSIDVKTPPLETSLKTFKALSHQIGSDHVIWRYDPIVFSADTGAQFHINTYGRIARELRGYTTRSIISIVDIYTKTKGRLNKLKKDGVEIIPYDGHPTPRFDGLMRGLAQIASDNSMEIQSCAEPLDLQPYGIKPGKCIDDEYITRAFGITVGHKKDPSQRDACGCVQSRDIGMYDTCLFGCQYCYATTSFAKAKEHFESHDPASPSLVGWYHIESSKPEQRSLFTKDPP